MKRNCLLAVSLVIFCGCTVKVDVSKKGELNLGDGIEVIKAEVENPYPECDKSEKGKESRRIADLEADRSKRVYIEEGELCQRSDF